MKPKPEITAQTRQDLMDAFWELYSKEKIDKISVREIVGRAGYNRSTFYDYFPDVYDVLEHIETSVLPDLKAYQNMVQNPDLRLSLRHFTEIYSKNKKYYVVLLGKNSDPAFQEKIKNMFKSLIRERLKISDTEEFALECTMEYTVSAILGVLTYCFIHEENPDAEKIIQLLLDLMNNGVMHRLKWNISIE